MGQLAVGLAGAAVGSAFGAPALGFTAGTFLGGLLFPPDPIRIEGPRREDLRVSSSTHGRPIPEGWGVIRMPGNMIWTNGIREVQNTQEVGGKGGLGGPSQEQVTYSYFVDCSFAFANGPAEAILRVWADGKVIYDVRDPNTTGAQVTNVIKPGLNMRTYLGTEDQLPCPTIQAAQGAANTPAFRGTVYLTLESFELADFGNRIPQITAEIAFKAVGTNSGRLSADQDNQHEIVKGGIDYERNQVVGWAVSTPEALRVWDLTTLQEIRRQPEADIGLTDGGNFAQDEQNWVVSRHTGRYYLEGGVESGVRIHIIDADSLTEIGHAGNNSASGNNHNVTAYDPAQPIIAQLQNLAEGVCFASGLSGPNEVSQNVFLLGHSVINDGPVIVDVTNPAATRMLVWNNGPSITGSRGKIAEPPKAQECVFWVAHQSGPGNQTVTLVKWTVQFGARLECDAVAEFCNFTGVEGVVETTFPASTWSNDAFTSAFIDGPYYDETDGNLIFAINATGFGVYVWKYNKVLKQVQWTLKAPVKPVIDTQWAPHESTRIRNGRFGLADGIGSGNYAVIDTISGKLIDSGSNIKGDFAAWGGNNSGSWDDTLSCFTHARGGDAGLEQFCVGRQVGQGEPLSDVVAELSGDTVNGAGLTGAQYDVSQLASDTVRGYAVTRQMPVKQAIEPLFTAYDFDATEADDKIKYIKRGGASVAAIAQADIVAAAQIVAESRTQEVELPEKIDLGYIDAALDYQENMAQAKRYAAPLPTMYSRNNQALDLAIVFTAAEAKEIAERLLYTAWSQRQRLTFSLGDNFIKLVPTDVVTLTLDSGAEFDLRIVKEDIGLGHTQRYEAVVQDSTLQVASNAVADASLGFTEPDLPTSINTRLVLIDAPYLRDIDSTARQSIGLKLAMAGYAAGWQAGTLYDSPDGLAYSPAHRTDAPMVYGIINDKLPTGAQNLTDTTTTLTVSMIEGDLESVTDAQFIANEQVAIIGSPTLQNWEYVAFRDAVQAASGQWTVSHLMRGRRGTMAPEISDSHIAGELFIVADRATVHRILLPLAQHNVTRYYKGVGRNSFLENATVVPLASKGRPLMPFQPYQLTAAVDGSDNIDFAWQRSDRLFFELLQTAGWNDSNLSEDAEEYEVDIYDQPGGTVVRTLTGLTTKAGEYTKAQLITDLGVSNATATIDVGSASTFTQASGSFITDGFVAGMKIETANFTAGANNGIFTVQTVAALTLTVEETTLVTETGTGDETVTAIRGDDITFEVFQISAQVGRGFGSVETTIPL